MVIQVKFDLAFVRVSYLCLQTRHLSIKRVLLEMEETWSKHLYIPFKKPFGNLKKYTRTSCTRFHMYM